MMGKFCESLLASLIGFGLVHPLLIRGKFGRWRPVTAIVIEVATFTLGAASCEIVFGLCPELRQGWRDLATRMLVIWLFVLPGWYVASRIRKTQGV